MADRVPVDGEQGDQVACLRCGAPVDHVTSEPAFDNGALFTNDPCGCARFNGPTTQIVAGRTEGDPE